jgi:Tfp pilus assembly PilM family ATPase
MRSSLPFFKIFPPPKFILMPHAGLDISDDGARFIVYSGVGSNRRIQAFDAIEFPEGLFADGDAQNDQEFIKLIAGFAKKNGIHDVKVSVPEEKAYLFQTDVLTTVERDVEQNIEFKLEENVPLAAQDAVFYFDLLPKSVTGGSVRASVSVVPRTYIERYTKLLVAAGLEPVSFETVPKAIARAVVHETSDTTRLIIHFMKRKTGIYITSGNVIHFTFTAPWGTTSTEHGLPKEELRKEIARIRSYWLSHGNGKPISEAMLVGKGVDVLEPTLQDIGGDMPLSLVIPNIWENALDLDAALPPIPKSDSLEYAVAAGLAFDTPGRS